MEMRFDCALKEKTRVKEGKGKEEQEAYRAIITIIACIGGHTNLRCTRGLSSYIRPPLHHLSPCLVFNWNVISSFIIIYIYYAGPLLHTHP